MTKNQIAFQEYKERARANRAAEEHNRNVLSEQVRSNYVREGETLRSNLARETETARSNLANEQETKRANQVRELETQRANLARELETNRANRATEDHNRAVLNETQRSNQAREAETYRSNLAREIETNRSNLANENLAHLQREAQKQIAAGNNATTLRAANIAANASISNNLRDNLTRNLINEAQMRDNQRDRVSRENIANRSNINALTIQGMKDTQTALNRQSNEDIAARNRTQQYITGLGGSLINATGRTISSLLR